jgi:hypothetical protein
MLAAGAIHLAATPVHLDHDLAYGVGFAVMGAVQLGAGVGLLARGGRRLLIGIGLFDYGVVALWAISRTIGVAGFSEPARPEPIGLADGVATALEVLVVAAVVALVARPTLGARPVPRLAARTGLGLLAAGVVAFAAPAVAVAPNHVHDDHTHALAVGGHAGHQHSTAGNALVAAQPHNHDGAASVTVHDHGAGAVLFGEHPSAPCAPTPDQQAAANKLVDDTRTGMARLRDVRVAESEGYMRFGDVAIAGTWHYINWKYQADPHVLDPQHPESIVYWQATPQSPLILIGAMYIMPKVGDAGPQVGGCLTTWHVHGEPFAPPGRLTSQMLHVWLVPMPDGPFS